MTTSKRYVVWRVRETAVEPMAGVIIVLDTGGPRLREVTEIKGVPGGDPLHRR